MFSNSQVATEEKALIDTLSLAAQLRSCLRFDFPVQEESELEASARKAADQLEHLVSHIKELEAWKKKGDEIFNLHTHSAMFSLGAWWADRPWRHHG